QMRGRAWIGSLGRRVRFEGPRRGLDSRSGRGARHDRHGTPEMGVPPREFTRAVEIALEKVDRFGIAGVGREIGVRLLETARLPAAEPVERNRQRWIGMALAVLPRHALDRQSPTNFGP